MSRAHRFLLSPARKQSLLFFFYSVSIAPNGKHRDLAAIANGLEMAVQAGKWKVGDGTQERAQKAGMQGDLRVLSSGLLIITLACLLAPGPTTGREDASKEADP